MRAHRGKAWLAAVVVMVLVMAAPLPGRAAMGYAWQNSGRLPIYLAATQSSMEAQMLEEKSSQAAPSGPALLQKINPSLRLNQDGATVKFPYNLEMNISVHYNREPAAGELKPLSETPLLMKYSMDYRLLPNLQVGLSSYLYRPDEDPLAFPRPRANRLGFGPQLKYNLGQWSFLLKSQMESGNREQPEGLQNWFRVWYAF